MNMDMRRLRKIDSILYGLVLVTVVMGLPSLAAPPDHKSDGRVVLENFQGTADEGFPPEWEAQNSVVTAKKSYKLRRENGLGFLKARDASQRVFKRVAWDPKAKPILTWRWRVNRVSEGSGLIAAVYVSLDTDLVVIPVATKYTWHASRPKGATTDGGIFGASEIVIRSGQGHAGEWVQERVNAYEDFKQLHGHEPAPEAWGISLLGGPGVEVDFGPIEVTER